MLVIGFVVMGLALFLSAGTIQYWQAWVYLAVGAVTSTLLSLFIMKDPMLLESRTKVGLTAEQRPVQKVIVWCMGLVWIGSFVVPGLDRRFGWSSMPSWLSIGGNLLIVVSMWMVYRVFKENSFPSATVEIGKEQKVITAGPYAIVRNPMYSSAMVYFVAMSLSLGSFWGLIPSILMTLGFALRLSDEEKLLAQNLPGYMDYCSKVRWHLVPGIY
jgi:protein-S-isoprenylcysteine O-methyltransferase Ste14